MNAPFFQDNAFTLYVGDAREVLGRLGAESVQTCVTSPPYWGLRDYGNDHQIGLEPTPADYVATLVGVFKEVRRVLRNDGTLWLNLGDSYSSHKGKPQGVDPKQGARRFGLRPNDSSASGLKHKDLAGVPWRVALALQADGWYLRSDIIWHKRNPMPERVADRPTKAHEYVFLLAKQPRYYYDAPAIAEGSPADGVRNKRSVWTLASEPTPEAHFATFPQKLVVPCVFAGSRPGDTVLDPFMGSGTTAIVARSLGRKTIGVELNPEYAQIAVNRYDNGKLVLR